MNRSRVVRRSYRRSSIGVAILIGLFAVVAAAPAGWHPDNPFRSFAEFRFHLEERHSVTLLVRDFRGRPVATPLHEAFPPGDHVVEFDGEGLDPGAYLLDLDAGSGRLQRIIVVR